MPRVPAVSGARVVKALEKVGFQVVRVKGATTSCAIPVEAFVPSFLTRLRDDQYVDAEHIGVGHVRFDVGRHDPVTQRLDESHVVLSPEGLRFFPIVTRYAWPSELDLMARIAGLRLRDRWGGWEREPFTSTSRNHVSVYGH